MSKISRFFLWIIVFGLAFIVGMRLYRAYEQKTADQNESSFSTMMFNNVPVQQGASQAPQPVLRRWTGTQQEREVYLEDAALSQQDQKEQARQTIASILRDYSQDPLMQAFYADLREATGREDLDLAALSGEELPRLLQQYPQLQNVISEYAQNPQFAKMLQEIFSNPQFAHSVVLLQTNEAANSSVNGVAE